MRLLPRSASLATGLIATAALLPAFAPAMAGAAPAAKPAASSHARYARGTVISVAATLSGVATGGGQTQLVRVLVGGRTQAEATATVRKQLSAALHRTLTVTVAPGTHKPEPLLIGMRTVVQEPATVTLPAPGVAPLRTVIKLKANVGGVAKLVARATTMAYVAPVDAFAKLGSGPAPILNPGTVGTALDPASIGPTLLAAMRTGKAAFAETTTAQHWTASTLGVVIVVHTGTNYMQVFRKDKLAQTITVATGATGYPSPHGSFHVVNKQPAPYWYNPHDDWSASLPDVIGPGPDNPLGTRALGLDSPGILIHGIPEGENASLGSNASHGCVRVRRSDIEALYPTIPVGTPVLLVQ